MTTQRLIKISRWTAFLSFLIGTIIFLVYFFADIWQMLFIGYGFIFIAGILNIILISLIHSHWTKQKSDRKILLKTGLIILLNIPVAVFYFGMTFILLNTIRLTLTNPSDSSLTNIDIKGCEDKKIRELKPGESEEVWVHINGDCQIKISYRTNGVFKSEVAFGYATNNGGQKAEYKIGTDEKLRQ